MALKICKDCGSQISSKAKTCPKCGKEQQNFFMKHKIITLILILFIVGAIGLSLGNSKTNTVQTSSNNTNNTKVVVDNKITLEKFNKIQNGMTYNEVVEIIGEEGTVLSDSDLGMGEEYHTLMYYWYGMDGISNANITIQGGKVISKAQIGLK